MDPQIITSREFEWKLHNFTSDFIKTDNILKSKIFSIFHDMDETKWFFYITINYGFMGIFLQFVESEFCDFVVTWNSFVRKVNNDKYANNHISKSCYEYKKNGNYGWSQYIDAAHICNNHTKFLKDETLTLSLKVELKKSEEINKYQEINREYFKTKSYADFKLICSNQVEIPVHRFILAGFSPVMKAIFDSTQINSFKIDDIDSKTMIEILRYIYTQKVHNLKKLAVKILYGAEKYELLNLKKLCVASMIKSLRIGNAIDYFIFGDKYKNKVLLKESAKFIKLHYEELAQNGEIWSKLDNKYLFMLLDFFHQCPDDAQVFESTL